MAIAGAGAGVNELTALAATSEMAPTRKRGVYVAVLIFTIVPFCPSVLWAQLIAAHSSWRYVGAFCGAWNGFGLLITVLFYKPPPRVNSLGLSRKEIISRIDFVGGFLSIFGLILFMAGMQWGGYMVCLISMSPCMCSGSSNALSLYSTPGALLMSSLHLSSASLCWLLLLSGRFTALNTPSSPHV
jgi:hypothetical protein